MTAANTALSARPSVNHCECSGCQACVEMCPELFQWDDQGECVVVADESVDREDVERAMAYCPNDCIEIEDG